MGRTEEGATTGSSSWCSSVRLRLLKRVTAWPGVWGLAFRFRDWPGHKLQKREAELKKLGQDVRSSHQFTSGRDGIWALFYHLSQSQDHQLSGIWSKSLAPSPYLLPKQLENPSGRCHMLVLWKCLQTPAHAGQDQAHLCGEILLPASHLHVVEQH